MKSFFYFLLQIFAIFVLAAIVSTISISFVEPINSIDWNQVEKFEKNKIIYENILMIPAVLIGLLFIIKVIIATIRLIKGDENKKIWIWRYAIRGCLIVLLVGFIPSTINEEKLSQIYKIKINIAEDIKQKYLSHINKVQRDFIFDKDFQIMVYPGQINQNLDTFEGYLASHPLENQKGVKRIDQLFEPQKDNYVCQTEEEKGSPKRVALYYRDLANDKHKLKFFVLNNERLNWGEKWSGFLSKENIGGPGIEYDDVHPFLEGEYEKKTAFRKARYEFKNNILSIREYRYTIEPGCWNKFECDTVTVGSRSDFKMSCAKTNLPEIINKINTYRDKDL